MMHDLSTLDKKDTQLITTHSGSFANFFPAVWYQSFEGGNIWVTTLGHDKANYQEATFKNHLLQGIKFIANQYKGIDYSKAVAMDKDAQLKN